MRKSVDTTKWTGSASFDISLIKNTNEILRIDNKTHIQYKDSKHLWLFVNDLNIQKTESNSLVNKGTQHLRYNHKIFTRIKMEAFAQAQYDAISEIKFRGLLGTGPRFILSEKEKYKFYLGTLIMYEYEKALGNIENNLQRDVRGSSYFSFNLIPTETISIISTSYFQPKLELFSDFRLSNDTSLLFKILKNLAFKLNFNYLYDAFPVSSNIPKTQFEITNGLLYSF